MKTVLTVTMLLAFAVSFGQEETPMIQWIGKINNASTSAKMSGVQIKVLKEDKQVSSFTNEKAGKFKSEEYECGYRYKIVFSKANFISKSLLVDVDKNYFPEDMDELTILESDILMVPKQKEVVYDEIETAAGSAKINTSTGYLGWDTPFATKCKKRFDDFLVKVDQSLADLATAKSLYKDGKYEEAGKAFENIDSKMIIPSILNKLDSDIQAGISNGPQAQYRKLIAKADSYFEEGELDKSEGLYKRAVEIKKADTHPVKMLKLIDEKRKILLVTNEPDPVDRPVHEVVTIKDPIRTIETDPIAATSNSSSSTVSSGSKNITQLRAYVGDDLLEQKEKYEAYNRELSSRTRSYSSNDYYRNYRTRAYTPPGNDKTARVREYNSSSHLDAVAARGRKIQENRGTGE